MFFSNKRKLDKSIYLSQKKYLNEKLGVFEPKLGF